MEFGTIWPPLYVPSRIWKHQNDSEHLPIPNSDIPNCYIMQLVYLQVFPNGIRNYLTASLFNQDNSTPFRILYIRIRIPLTAIYASYS